VKRAFFNKVMASRSSICQVKCLFLISAAKTLVLSLFHSSRPPTQRKQQYQKASQASHHIFGLLLRFKTQCMQRNHYQLWASLPRNLGTPSFQGL